MHPIKISSSGSCSSLPQSRSGLRVQLNRFIFSTFLVSPEEAFPGQGMENTEILSQVRPQVVTDQEAGFFCSQILTFSHVPKAWPDDYPSSAMAILSSRPRQMAGVPRTPLDQEWSWPSSKGQRRTGKTSLQQDNGRWGWALSDKWYINKSPRSQIIPHTLVSETKRQ